MEEKARRLFRRRLQEMNLDILVANDAFQFSNTFFPYTSGEIGPYYVSSERAVMNGETKPHASLKWLIENTLSPQEARESYVVSGGEMRDFVFSLPVAGLLGKPHVMIGKDKRLIGPSIKGKKVIHVADLNNEGSSPTKYWIPTLREGGAIIDRIFFYVDRLEHGVDAMKTLDLDSQAVVPLDKNAWDYLKQKGTIDGLVYHNLQERREDRNGWATRMLQSEQGFNRVIELLRGEPKKKEMMKKVIIEGCPRELCYELIGKLVRAGVKLNE